MSTLAATNLKHESSASNNIVLDSSGNVGIGTSSPSSYGKLAVIGTSGTQQAFIGVGGDGWTFNTFSSSSAYLTYGSVTVTTTAIGNQQAIPLAFLTTNTERMRIDSSGNFVVGSTSSTVAGKNAKITAYQTASSPSITSYNNTTANTNQIIFVNPNGEVGTINTSGTTTSYNTNSDYRLKYDVQPMVNGLSTVAALKPVTYKWNADNSYGEGFIAHELQEVIPNAVSGEKDAVNKDGSMNLQGVDYSKVVVHLVAAIQELSAKVAALEGKQ